MGKHICDKCTHSEDPDKNNDFCVNCDLDDSIHCEFEDKENAKLKKQLEPIKDNYEKNERYIDWFFFNIKSSTTLETSMRKTMKEMWNAIKKSVEQ